MDDSDPVAIKDAHAALQRPLAEQAQAGVPEQVLVGLLTEEAAEISGLHSASVGPAQPPRGK